MSQNQIINHLRAIESQQPWIIQSRSAALYLICRFTVDEGGLDEGRGPVAALCPATGEEHSVRVENGGAAPTHGHRQGLQCAECGSIKSLVDGILGKRVTKKGMLRETWAPIQ